MAERRMFSKTIVDSDAFLDLPLTTQSLYFHLSVRADDDGFINNPKKIQRMIGASDYDMQSLIANDFIIGFDSGVVVIRHWKVHNYIQKDRYHETIYQAEKACLTLGDNNVYTLDTSRIQGVYKMEAEVSIGKDSIGKYSQELDKVKVAKANKAYATVKDKYSQESNEEYEFMQFADEAMYTNPDDYR